MLTVVNRKDQFTVVKCHHNGTIFEYQVHDTTLKNPVIARFNTKREADDNLGLIAALSKSQAAA